MLNPKCEAPPKSFLLDILPRSKNLKVWHSSANQCFFQVSLCLGPSSQSGVFPISSPILLPQHRSVRLLQQVYLWIRPRFIPFPFPPWPRQSRPLSQGIFLLDLLPSATTLLTCHCGTAQRVFCLPPHIKAQHLSSGFKYQASTKISTLTVFLF